MTLAPIAAVVRRRQRSRVFAFIFAVAVATPLYSLDLTIVQSPEELFEKMARGSDLIVVNFWATWCQPCIEEMPELATVQRRFEESHVRMIGIAMDDVRKGDRAEKLGTVRAFLSELGTEYPNFYYAGDAASLHAFWGISPSLPTTLILDATGVVIDEISGPVTSDSLIRQLRQLLGE